MRLSAYRELFRVPGLRWQALTGLLAQVTQGAGGIGTILVVRAHTGSLALAGVVVGALTVAAAVSRPIQGRILDRRDGRLLIVVCGLVHAAALIGIVALAQLHAPGIVLIALGVIAGVALPPISTAMRVGWGSGLAADERNSAYSLVYLTQEISILTGPLLLAVVIAAASASVALIVVSIVAGAGTIAFGLSMVDRPSQSASAGHQFAPGVLRSSGMRILLAIGAMVGAMIGALEVGVPTIATAHGNPAASGLLIAAMSLGGIAGATVYGARRWATAPRLRLALLLAAMTVTVSGMVPVSGLVALGVLMALTGIALNPVLTTASVLVDELVGTHSTAEAFGWLSSGLATGTGAANVIAAAVAHRSDAQAAFIVAAVATGAGLLLAVGGQRWLRSRPGLQIQENDVRNVRSEARV